jgi:hypothetical protein
VGPATQPHRAAQPGAIAELEKLGVPATWRQSLVTLLGVIDDLDQQPAPLEQELRAHAARTHGFSCW